MFGDRFLRSAGIALGVYGVLGLLIATAVLLVGYTTFNQVVTLQVTLESERQSLVRAIRTASGTLRDTVTATSDFERSIDTARGASDRASKLANDSAGTFRDLGSTMTSLSVFGLQPLVGLGPQFDRSADQLQQLAISLGATREALSQNSADVRTVTADLNRLQTDMDGVAASLSQPGVLGLSTQSVLPFQVAFYGMCLLMVMQSVFSFVAGVALYQVSKRPPPAAAADPVAFERADQLRDVS
jgi:hypothetical protein